MKHIVLAALSLATLFAACDQRNVIDVHQEAAVPDLNNPVVQKLTSTTWFKDVNLNIPNDSWSSTNYSKKASGPFEGMLYSMAWLGMELQRDGTSTLIFYPPVTKYQFLLCRGKWKTSPTDPNTVIIDTKTPVGYATMRVKVMDMQTKDNVAMIRTYIDTGNRVMMIDFFNGGSVLEGGSPTEFPDLRNMRQAWFDGMQVSRQPIDKSLFNNTAWEMSPHSRDVEKDFEIPQMAIRTTFINDLLTKTPSLVYGAKFNFAQDGNVYIDIPSVVKETAFRPWASQVEDKTIMVKGTWRTQGNRIIIETNELPFASVGEAVFQLPVDLQPLDVLFSDNNGDAVRVWKNYYIIIEYIKPANTGAWFRISSPQETYYLFMRKQPIDKLTDVKGVRETAKTLKQP
ncbi:hypothetical protein [Prevotella sp. oral taxon 317]|uniref:hypothetical protein n=1 Tax=Prevotella sp. oral taxon 317 TaxID=652721 RepID=UPI0001C3FEBB|nr:hypothetical protein [Prevotella sp. oral taxon 317]EFC67556.1 hypothetical protein HMPREF0670_02604 [Prevotella sp. oral taxon 317 str. F0108]